MEAWYVKHRPVDISQLIFDSDETKRLVKNWIETKNILGNVLLFGPPGVGKTATAEVIIRSIMKDQNGINSDVRVMKTRSVDEIDNVITPFVKQVTIKGYQKIVLIEEIDKLSRQAIGTLKDNLMEKYQKSCIFIATTNYLNALDSAILQRFTSKIPFNGTNKESIVSRLKQILEFEQAEFNENELKTFVENNIHSGIREMINQLQYSCTINNNKIDFQNIHLGKSLEETVVSLMVSIIKTVMTSNIKDRTVCMVSPLNSPIAKDYQELYATIHNNNVNYELIFIRLYNISETMIMKIIIDNHLASHHLKRIPQTNLISCLYEMINAAIEIIGV